MSAVVADTARSAPPAVALLPVRVARRRMEADGICSFELVADDGGALPAFSAGAHIDVHLPGGPVRQYSLCNSPAERHRYLIAVQREAASRGGSSAMHERVAEGDRLQIGAPRNHFALADNASSHRLLAAGIGITPLLAMAEQLAAQGADFELLWSLRSPASTAFAERLAGSPWRERLRQHHSDTAAGRIDFRQALGAPAPGRHLYVCGPAGFIDDALAAARALGWPESQLHSERFAAAPAADAGGDRAFEVQLAKSQRVVVVPAGTTIVRALAAAGITVPTSCEQGVCGTCLTPVLEGTPDHRDQYLTPEEQAEGQLMLPCCSRACSERLVLDL